MFELMRKTAFFADIAEAHVKAIAAFASLVTYQAGAQAIVEGEACQHMDLLLLVEGAVDVETKFSPLPTAMTFNLHAISSEMFGEIAWLLGGKRSASVKCRTSCKFIQIDGGKFYAYCHDQPAAGVELLSRIAALAAQRVLHLSEMLKHKELFS